MIEKLIAIARAEIGTKESPANSNNVKYNTWFYGKAVSGSAYSWCAVFISWLFFQAGMPLPKIGWLRGMASCPYAIANVHKWGVIIPFAQARAGDIITPHL